MTTPLISLYLISVGVFALGSVQAAFMARNSTKQRACWTFAATCLFFSFFQFACALQYSATQFPAALAAHKWVNFFSLVLLPMLWYLLASLEEKKSTYIAAYLSAALAFVVVLINYQNPFGYRFKFDFEEIQTSLDWGEQLWIFAGEPSIASRVIRLMSLVFIIFTIIFSIRILKLGEKFSSRLIWIAACIMLTTGILAAISDMGIIQMPYLGGFGFLFLAISFSALMGKDVSQRRIEELEIYHKLQDEIESRKIANLRVEHVLNNDELTGLPNRAGALIKVQELLAIHQANGQKLAVFLFNVDQLSIINGTRGHLVGDQLLLEVGQRLRNNLRDTDLIARLGSGRFIVAATNLKTERCITLVYEKLTGALALPFYIADSLLSITTSIGAAVFPDNVSAEDDMLAAAELALHDSKRSGTGKLRFFDPSLKANIQQKIAFEIALKEALEKKQFFLCYQPQILASNGQTVCLEALIRWQHPSYGLVMPDEFIKLAESMGLIASIGAWVIDCACEQLAKWRVMGFDQLRVAINLSAHQLLMSDLEETITATLAKHHLTPNDIELEITESVLMQDPDCSIERLTSLRKLGVRLSIDDFGTGYSSLAYLRVLPVHAFKLDKEFVWDMGAEGKGGEICATAIGLAQNIGLEVVAEGVETKEQRDQLQTLGCQFLQGYFFSKPLSVDAASQFLYTSTA